MSLQKLISNYVDYNSWVNQKYVDWLSAKPIESLNKETPSSFPTILRTMNHIWSTQEFWRGIIAETTDITKNWEAKEFPVDYIFEGLARSSSALNQFVHSLGSEGLEKLIKVETPWFQCELPRYEYIQHVIGHGTYHRGQIVTMGRHIGITDAPMTDYNFYNVYRQ